MWVSARRTEALLDIALDISEPDQCFLVHPGEDEGGLLRLEGKWSRDEVTTAA